MSALPAMQVLAQAYLAERRRLGFELDRSGSLTLAFASFADGNGHVGPLTAKIVLRWAKEGAARADPFTWAGRVAVLRPFARYLADHEPETRFPEDAPFGRSKRRLAPHIYSPAEIESLIMAAERLPGRLTSATFATLFGLLAASGMRISEALRLSIRDICDVETQITVHHSKFQRSRLVPLHPTATTAIRAYLRIRAKYGSMEESTPLFLHERTGERLTYRNVRSAFGQIAAALGIVARGGHQVVRIHDLRHSFICRRLMLWQEHGTDIGNAMMALSTYVGHVNLSDTYWYMQAVPDLMAIAGGRFEALSAKDAEVRHG